MILITPILYSISAIIFTMMFVMFTIVNKKNRANMMMHMMSYTILFFAIHAWAMALPAIIDAQNTNLLYWGHISGIAAMFGLMFVGLSAQSYLSNSTYRGRFILAKIGAVLFFMINLIFYIKYPHVPVIESHGVILWTAGIAQQLLAIIPVSIYAVYWATFFYKFSAFVSKPDQKRNMSMLSLNGFLGGAGSVFALIGIFWMIPLIGASMYLLSAILSMVIFILIPIMEGSAKTVSTPF